MNSVLRVESNDHTQHAGAPNQRRRLASARRRGRLPISHRKTATNNQGHVEPGAAAPATPARQLGETLLTRPLRPSWWPWDILVALLILVSVYALVSNQLRLGPVWLLPILVVVLLVPLAVAYRYERRRMTRTLTFAVAGIGTLAVQGSVILLVVRLLLRDVPAANLLRDAALLWVANVITFALWYWQLDGGGPHRRHVHGYQATDLAFPQTSLGKAFAEGWEPDFVDYLFVAFTASAAFSPTDTMFLSVRAKLLMMAQAMDSMIIIGVVAARAINILH